MKKLALVVPSLDNGGGVPAVARFIMNVALRSGRYQPQLVSLCMASNEPSSRLLLQPATWLRGPITRSGVWEEQSFIHVGANWAELEFQRYKPRKVLSELLADCDLIQLVCGAPAWANTVTGLGKPIALQVATRIVVERRLRDRQARGLMGWWRKRMSHIADHLDDRGLTAVDAIQVENPWMLDYAQRLNAGRSVDLRYAPPGIDASLFHPILNRNPTKDPYILCVGRLDDLRKNIGLLLEAYAQIPQPLRQTVRLVLAGAAGPDAQFWQRAQALGVANGISFIDRPSTEELVRLYQHAAVFALPSDEEGLGVVVLESMACGVPVVSTRSGGPDGVITQDEDGYLVPLDDAAAMAVRIQQLLTDPALNVRMGLKARATIERRYDEQVAGEEFLDMWDRLVQRRGAP